MIGGSRRVIEVAEQRADGQKLLVHRAPAGSGGRRAHDDVTVGGGRIVKAAPSALRPEGRPLHRPVPLPA